MVVTIVLAVVIVLLPALGGYLLYRNSVRSYQHRVQQISGHCEFIRMQLERAQSETEHFSHQNRILASRLASVAKQGLKPVPAESISAQEKPKPERLLGPSLQGVIDSIGDPAVRLQIEMEARHMVEAGTDEKEVEAMLIKGADMEDLL